ncbi:DUF1553 domain-containing protein, partial [Prosthecobacter sp.]|uniref:DUF1553 domain-containing protein n=1 Tax=Prosthecobacter sp. TaxID=1965333 RepID=UPI0024896F13
MALIETKSEVPATHVLLRGLAANQGDEVGPAVPVVLAAKSLSFPKSSGQTSLRRRTLAEWIASPANPLTWRVLANRVWQHHFGAGIVASPSNFGFSGAAPTHPELLDYLTFELIANGGRLKPLHKLILMSATYRQQSRGDPLAHDKDPGNTLLWRQNKQRMEAEVIRDSILSVSGRLNPKHGGAGFKPRIRPDLLDASQRNKWPIIEHEGPEQWRRSIYIYVKRQLLMPNMELFDAPTTTDSCALRMQSTVPTQALVLMNDEFVEEQAKFLAQRAMTGNENDERQTIQRLFLLTLAHSPSASRLEQAQAFVQQRAAESDLVQALADLAHVLLNSSEFIYID